MAARATQLPRKTLQDAVEGGQTRPALPLSSNTVPFQPAFLPPPRPAAPGVRTAVGGEVSAPAPFNRHALRGSLRQQSAPSPSHYPFCATHSVPPDTHAAGRQPGCHLDYLACNRAVQGMGGAAVGQGDAAAVD